MLGFAPIADLPLASLSEPVSAADYTDAEWIRVPEEVRSMGVSVEPREMVLEEELDMSVKPAYKTETTQARLRKP